MKIGAAKMWCYCRMVYMPMSYLYGKRFVCQITPLIQELRLELHAQPFDEINWKKTRHLCTKVYIICLIQSIYFVGSYTT